MLIVANRLPVHLTEQDDRIVVTPSAGGLVSSIKSYLGHVSGKTGEQKPPVWIGTLDITEKNFRNLQVDVQLPGEDFQLEPVFLSSATRDKFYNGFCNDTIWPLFHYFPSYARFRDDYFEHYVVANQRFCDKVVSLYQAGDIIWVHDYHLMLLPAMLRRRLPDATIGFFLHIPFPSFEIFRMLPGAWRKEILEGLLGSDLIGFHTNSYAQYFLSSVKQLLGYEISMRSVVTPERTVAVDVFPVSIDFQKFHSVFNQADIFMERSRIRKKLGEIPLVISVDRLDYTKGIINRLEGFELFLNEHPEYLHKITYMMIIVPSRDIITKYKELKDSIEGLVGRINGKYGSLDWTPVIYQYKAIDFQKLTALYMAADAALIIPVRDGMNLVAKEFVASRADRRGVLILSETAGAAAELGEAIIINPTDRKEIANALLQALTMPVAEQMSRNDFMQKRLRNYDVVKWAEEFIEHLRSSHQQQESLKVKIISAHHEEVITQHFMRADRRIFFLDYDGTLSPISRYPHQAVPHQELNALLTSIASDERNTVVIISGRPKQVLENWFGDQRVHLIAEHGAFYRQPGLAWQHSPSIQTEWRETVRRVLLMFTDRCPGSFIEEKEISLAWHYRNSDPELGFIRSRELHTNLTELASHLDFQVTEGKKVIEARPRGIDKGCAALTWLDHREYDFILAAGDDRTDEDLFKVLPPESYSIRVGLVQSAARYNVSQQKDILNLLAQFVVPQHAGDSIEQIMTS